MIGAWGVVDEVVRQLARLPGVEVRSATIERVVPDPEVEIFHVSQDDGWYSHVILYHPREDGTPG